MLDRCDVIKLPIEDLSNVPVRLDKVFFIRRMVWMQERHGSHVPSKELMQEKEKLEQYALAGPITNGPSPIERSTTSQHP